MRAKDIKSLTDHRDTYDTLANKAELADNLTLIDQGLEDVKTGQVRDARDGIRTLAAKHGLGNISPRLEALRALTKEAETLGLYDDE